MSKPYSQPGEKGTDTNQASEQPKDWIGNKRSTGDRSRFRRQPEYRAKQLNGDTRMKYYGHFSKKHLLINNRIIILGLTKLQYFDLKTKKIVKWGKYDRKLC